MYTIVGGDQKEYGPVSEEQIKAWINEGRVYGPTIARYQDGAWKPLSTFPEFAPLLSASGPHGPGQVFPPLLAAPVRPVAGSNGWAVAGAVLGCLSLVQCCVFITAPLGMICSGIGWAQIAEQPEKYTTVKSTAMTGLVLSILGLGLHLALLAGGLFTWIWKVLPR